VAAERAAVRDSETAMSPTLENDCAALERKVADVRRKTRDFVRLLTRLEAAARAGDLVGIEKLTNDVSRAREHLFKSVDDLMSGLEAKVGSDITPEAYLTELEEALKAEGLVFRRSGGGCIVPPLYVRVDLRSRSIRLGKQRIRTLRPIAVVPKFKRLRERASRGTQTFLQSLYRAYRFLNRYQGREGESAVELEQLFQAMTLAPDGDYTREAFALDLVRLEAQPDLRTSDGRRIELVGSTGSRHGKRITAYRDDGSRVDFVAVRFVKDP
jgi:hypothetical protein